MVLLTKKAILFSPASVRMKKHAVIMKNAMVTIDAVLSTTIINLVMSITLAMMMKATLMRMKMAQTIPEMTANAELTKTNLKMTKMKVKVKMETKMHP